MPVTANSLQMIPFGVVVLAEPGVPETEMRRDLENIRHLHFNTIVLYPSISRWEGALPGQIAFGAIDRVMDICEELELKVILELQGQVMQDADAPESSGYRQSENYRENGFHDPGKRKLLADYLRKVAEHFKGHPALLAYDLFNEIGNDSRSPHTIQAFIVFLRQQYVGNIEALNLAWATYFTDFEAIALAAPNFRIWSWSSVLAERDWQRFRFVDFANQIAWWKEIVREIDPNVPLFVDVLGSDVLHNRTDAYFGVSDWDIIGQSDVLGLSCYANMLAPEWWKKDAWLWPQFWRHALSVAAEKQVMISELMTQNRTLFPRERSSMTDELSLWSYQAIFHGIQGIIYWKYRPFRRGRQVGGRGLTDSAGEPNVFAQQASEVARFMESHATGLANARPDDAGCCILHDPEAERLYSAIGFAEEHGKSGSFYTDAHRGWFKAFWSMGVSPSYVTPERMETQVPASVRVLAVPCLANLSANLAAKLTDFVERGGVLITESRFGIVDSEGILWPHTPGAGLHGVTGFEETNFSCRFTDRLRLSNGEMIFEDDYFQELRCQPGVEVVARTDGDFPAMVISRRGQGTFIHIPFLLGHLIEKEKSATGAAAFFDVLFALLRPLLRPAIEVMRKDAYVDVSTLLHPSGQPYMTGICNYARQAAQISLRLPDNTFLLSPDGREVLNGAVDNQMTLEISARSHRTLFFGNRDPA